MKPLRILMFARYLPPEYSGAAAQALLLADRLRARGHRVELATQSWTGEPRDYLIDGFPVKALRTRLSARHQEFSVWRSLFAHVWRRRRDLDILHGHGAYYTQSILGPLGRLFGKGTLLKASLSNNDLTSLSDTVVAPVHRRFLRMVDTCVAISDDLRAEMIAKGIPEAQIRDIPNGVDTQRFHPVDGAARAQAAADLGLPAGQRIALYVGVFDERKRISWLVERWLATEGFGTGALLLAVGPVSREGYGEAMKARLIGIAAQRPDLVAIRDFHPDIHRFYQAADLFVFPSSREGLPNAVLEAMATGLPSVVARASGSRELIQDGRTGATFAIDDADGLHHALTRVAGDAGRRLGAEGRRISVEQFDIERIADRYVALYRQLSARRR